LRATQLNLNGSGRTGQRTGRAHARGDRSAAQSARHPTQHVLLRAQPGRTPLELSLQINKPMAVRSMRGPQPKSPLAKNHLEPPRVVQNRGGCSRRRVFWRSRGGAHGRLGGRKEGWAGGRAHRRTAFAAAESSQRHKGRLGGFGRRPGGRAMQTYICRGARNHGQHADPRKGWERATAATAAARAKRGLQRWRRRIRMAGRGKYRINLPIRSD